MKLLFTIATGILALGVFAACSSTPAKTEEPAASVAPQMPAPAVTETPAAASTEPAPAAQEQKTETTKKKTSKKKSKK